MRWLAAALALLLLSLPGPSGIARSDQDTVSTALVDSSVIAPAGQVTAAMVDTVPSAYTPTKSPGLAILFSALVPGAGQVYNESYWKAPIVAGLGIYFASQWLHYNRLTVEARDRYHASLATIPSGDQLQLRLREFYKDQRDTYTWYFFILYLVNVADAYVDASLYDFDVGDDLSIRVQPSMSTPTRSFGLDVRIHF